MRSTWLALVAVLVAAGVARAEPTPRDALFSAAIYYTAPPTCPSLEEFESVVVGRLGFDPFAVDAPDHVLVSIDEGEGTLEGRLEWRDKTGRWTGDRTFPVHTTDCAELARAMGFALAVQINLLAGGAGSAPSRPSSALPAATAADGVGPPAAPAEPRRLPWSLAVGAGGALGVGMAPNAIGLGRLFAGIGWGRWSLELGGELSTRAVDRRADGAGYRQQILLASAAACGSEAPVTLCLLAKGGVVNVAGRSIDVPASPSGRALQAGLRLGARERLGSRAFVAERIEALVNVTRWNVTLDQVSVWKAPTFAGTFGVDLGADF